MSGKIPPQSNPSSRPGVDESPSQIAPVDQGIFLADFPLFFNFFLSCERSSNRPGVVFATQSNFSTRTRGIWTLPFEISHLYKVGMIFWEVFQLRSSMFRVFV